MSETTFALQILNSLNPLPITRPADSNPPPNAQPTHTPILPKMPKSYILPSTSSSSQPSTTTTVTLKPLKGASVVLEGLAWDISILEIKVETGRRTGYGVDKIKVLWAKRPVSDSKTLREVVGEGTGGKSVELGVMFVGAPSVTSPASQASEEVNEAPVAQGESGEEVLGTESFWDDLRGFVLQRVRDEKVAHVVIDVFRKGWTARTG